MAEFQKMIKQLRSGFYLQNVPFSVKVQSFNVTAMYGEKGSKGTINFAHKPPFLFWKCLCLKLASLYGPVNVTKRPLFTKHTRAPPCI